MQKKLRENILDIVVVGVGILLIGFMLLLPSLSSQELPFNSRQWKDDDPGCSMYFRGVRPKMRKDLVRTLMETRPRFTMQQVEEILGEPEYYRDKNLLSYNFGSDIADCLSFDVTFDALGKVKDAGVVQH